MKFASSALAAALVAFPFVATAQTAPAAETAVVEKSTTVVVKEAPKASPVTFTPYGFLLFNAFFNDAVGARNYPYPTYCSGGAKCEGNILMDVRQTRLGARLAFDDTAGWTKASLAGLVEVDFQGGYTSTAASSFGFYSPVVRLRKAYVDAGWNLGGANKLTLRIGQDDEIPAPLRPLSLAYIANPLFQYAGTLNGRAPMIAVRYDLTPKDGLAVAAVLAAVNPQDNTAGDSAISPGAAVDLGAGNRSRLPSFQGRVGAGYRSGGKTLANVNLWGGWQKDRFVSPATDTNVDVNARIIGGDVTVNYWWLQAMGTIYTARGWDQPGSLGATQGVALSVSAAPVNITSAKAIKATGGWFQIAFGPSDLAQVYGGWGGTQTPFSELTGSILGTNALANTSRVQNYMWALGVIGYAGKNWRFSAEYAKATSWFYSGNTATQGQFSLNSQVVF